MKRTPQVAAFLNQARERMLDKADGSTYTLTVGDAMEVLREMLPWGTDASVLSEYATLRDRLHEASSDMVAVGSLEADGSWDGLGSVEALDADYAADIVENLAKATPPRIAGWFERMEDGEKIRLTLKSGTGEEVAEGTLVGFRDLPTVVVKLAPHCYTSWPLPNVVEKGTKS